MDLIFRIIYNDLRGMVLLVGLIFRLDPSDPSAQRDRDRLNGIDFGNPLWRHRYREKSRQKLNDKKTQKVS
jgi:hypothetical protein